MKVSDASFILVTSLDIELQTPASPHLRGHRTVQVGLTKKDTQDTIMARTRAQDIAQPKGDASKAKTKPEPKAKAKPGHKRTHSKAAEPEATEPSSPKNIKTSKRHLRKGKSLLRKTPNRTPKSTSLFPTMAVSN